MRLLTPVLLISLAAAAAGFTIRRIIYLNDTVTEHDDRLPYVGGSIIQVPPSDSTVEKFKNIPNTNRFPRFSNKEQYVEATTPTVTHSQLVNRRIARELGSGRKLMRQLEEEILRESMTDIQRNTRTLIQAPLLQKITCPTGQKLDRGGKKCRPPW